MFDNADYVNRTPLKVCIVLRYQTFARRGPESKAGQPEEPNPGPHLRPGRLQTRRDGDASVSLRQDLTAQERRPGQHRQ